MTRRTLSAGLFAAVVLPALLLLAGCGRPDPLPVVGTPNVLFIIADDLNWRDLGVTGNPDVKSPNIDGLARDGMHLRGMFSPSPTCTPARHALYTGLFPVRSGGYPNHSEVYEGTKSIFSYLKEAGYRVALMGKAHVNPRSSYPFKLLSKDADDLRSFDKFVRSEPGQPWLVAFSSKDPHGPWNRGPGELYDPAKLSVPPYLYDNDATRRELAAYYAEISRLDEQVGELLKIVAATGQEDNTIVIFISEQGNSLPFGGKSTLYDNGIRAAVFVRWPGRIAPGSYSDALLQYVDIAPTLLEILGLDPDAIDTGSPDAAGNRGFDGRSFLGILMGDRDHGRDYVFAQHTTLGQEGRERPYPIRAVRDARYKLIRNLAWQSTLEPRQSDLLDSWKRDAGTNPWLAGRIRQLSHRPAEELYDLDADPFEMNNLAQQPALSEVRSRLGAELDAWMLQQGDEGLPTELKALSRQR